MQRNPSATLVLNHPSLDHSSGGQASTQGGTRPAHLLESADLLRGSKTVAILHNGSLYRLQATKLGKLILTK